MGEDDHPKIHTVLREMLCTVRSAFHEVGKQCMSDIRINVILQQRISGDKVPNERMNCHAVPFYLFTSDPMNKRCRGWVWRKMEGGTCTQKEALFRGDVSKWYGLPWM